LHNIYDKIQSFLKLNKTIFPALKIVHRSVRQRRFTLEADFPEMGFPNNASESTKLMSLEMACYYACHSFNVYHWQHSRETIKRKHLLEHNVAFLHRTAW